MTDECGAFPLIFYYHRLNSFSFNALAGAVDAVPELAGQKIGLAFDEDEVSEFAADALRRNERVVLAVSMLTCQFEEMKRLFGRLRENFGSNITILAGGPHVTACPEEVLQAGADIAFRGEAEAQFPVTIQNVYGGRECGGIIAPHSPVDIDKYFSISPRRGMFGPIEISRGCAFACRFCQTSRIFGVRLRHRSIDNIVRQAESLRSVNRKVVRLLSPNAFSYGSMDGRDLNMKAIRDLLAALRQTVTAVGKIIFAHFPSEARPEHITPDTLDLLNEFADNDEIVIGAQSGSPRMLDICNRSHTVEDILRAVKLARRCGCKVIVDFMLGLPDETEEDMRESVRVMREVVRRGARIHFHTFAPLPQTAFAHKPPGIIAPFYLEAIEEFRAERGIYETAPRRGRKSGTAPSVRVRRYTGMAG
ncbi:MAG TPA: TIGR04013 family B12-binding domain/radical SAM domain-containing protein [Acidobacteriota bacterium]|nr:TIGR04013 family B12-binding domain/radical SAM domain-containing protein [Acidobacteriota bacterium]